jgi:hypothetical protein
MEVSPFVTTGKEDFGGYAEGIPGDIETPRRRAAGNPIPSRTF